MEITATELRGRPGKIMEQVARGVEVIVTVRGKRLARIVPIEDKAADSSTDQRKDSEDEIFGLWKDREDLDVVRFKA